MTGPLGSWCKRRGVSAWRPIDLGKAIRPFIECAVPRGPLLNVGCGKREKQWPGRWVHTDGPWRAGTVALDLERPLPFRDGAFPAVVAKHVLEHVWRLDALVAELYRVAAPGALFVAQAPLQGEEGPTRAGPLEFRSRQTQAHCRNITARTWARLARATGWDLLAVEEAKDARWHETYAVFQKGRRDERQTEDAGALYRRPGRGVPQGLRRPAPGPA